MPPPPSGGWDGRSRNAPYGSHSHGPPPHAASHSTWGSHGSPPPGYSSRGVPPPPSHGISDRYYSSTHHPHPTSRGHGMGPSSSNNSHGIHEHEESSRSSYPHNSWNPHGPPPSGSWSRHGPPPPQQSQAQPPPTNPYGTSNYGPPPPPQHLSHGPPSSSSSQLYGSQGGWNTRSGSAATPPRSVYREMDMSYMTNSSVAGSTGRSPMDDDGGESSAGGSNRDKGRGSYKCGRCGVPKKGHLCPYQPKMKKPASGPPPNMRNAAVQVEMDEFLTLRRLNLKIQGFPESYAAEPYMSEHNMVVGEPHPSATSPVPPPRRQASPDRHGRMMPMDPALHTGHSITAPLDSSVRSASSRRGSPPVRSKSPDRPGSSPRMSPLLTVDTGVGDGSLTPDLDHGGEMLMENPMETMEEEKKSPSE